MKVVMLGATRGMGQALARRMASRGDAVFLLGNEADDLQRSARDLEACSGGTPVGTAPCDLLDPATFGPALVRAEEALGVEPGQVEGGG